MTDARCEGCVELAALKGRLDRLLSAGVRRINVNWDGISVTANRIGDDGEPLRDDLGKVLTFDTQVYPWLHDPETGPWYPSLAAVLERVDARVRDNPTLKKEDS